MYFLIIFLFALPITGWLSYYTSASVYKSLKKNDYQYARTIQVLVFLGMFAVLVALAVYFVVSSIRLER
jgi:Mn2+/Fe2+ NRAMP family transporter